MRKTFTPQFKTFITFITFMTACIGGAALAAPQALPLKTACEALSGLSLSLIHI